MVATGVAQKHITTRCSDGTQKCSSFDAVGHYAVVTAIQFFHTLDANAAGAMSFDLGAHGNQHFGQVRNFRFLGGVFQNGFALCQGRSHQKVFGAGDRHHVGGDTRTMQTGTAVFQTRQHVAVLDVNHRAHGL